MKEKLIKFTELCRKSRHEGLDKEGHQLKVKICQELVDEGILYLSQDKGYCFKNPEDAEYFNKHATKNQKI